MIANNINNMRVPEASFARAHEFLPESFTEENIKSIKPMKLNNTPNEYLYVVELNNMTHKWYVGLRAKITETNYLDGEWEIVKVDNDNKKITIKASYSTGKELQNKGKAIMVGVVNNNTIPGEPLYNDDKKIVAYTYSGLNYFLIDVNKDLMDTKEILIQVINLGQSSISVDIKWSLDGVYWIDFMTPIIFNVGANKSDGIFVTQIIRNMKIAIKVNGDNNSKYYVLYS